MNKIYDKYGIEKQNRPRLHPVVQLIGGEWLQASNEKRDVSWTSLTHANVIQLCRHHAQTTPDWNANLTAERLDSYLGEIPPNQLWYNFQPEAIAADDDGVSHLIIYHLEAYRIHLVHMADPAEGPAPAGPPATPADVPDNAQRSPAPAGPSTIPAHAAPSPQPAPTPAGPPKPSAHPAVSAQPARAPGDPSTTSKEAAPPVLPPPPPPGPVAATDPPAPTETPPPLPPPSASSRQSRPVRACRVAKGKEPAVVVDPPPREQVKRATSTRGKKRSAPSPAPAGPDDQQSDADGDVDLPRVQVQHPSSPQQSSSALEPPVETATGEVSVFKAFLKHMRLQHVQDRCGPCKEKNIPECKSQRKGRPTYACQSCNKKKVTCHKPHPSWALPMLGIAKGAVYVHFC